MAQNTDPDCRRDTTPIAGLILNRAMTAAWTITACCCGHSISLPSAYGILGFDDKGIPLAEKLPSGETKVLVLYE